VSLVKGPSSSSEDEDETWLVASMTRLKVPWPSCLTARQRRRFLSWRPRASKYSGADLLLVALDPDPGTEKWSLAVDEDSLGGGVGGFSMGVRPLASDKCGSRRIAGWLSVTASALACEPDTVTMRLGTKTGSGIYSLMLLLRVCRDPWLVSPLCLAAWPSTWRPRPAYDFLLFWAPRADAIDSPVLVTSTLSDDMGARVGASRDVRLPSFFHGPGESDDSKGEGSGVTSPMAEMMGLATVELAVEALPRALAKAPVLKLGVRETGLSDEADDLRCREDVPSSGDVWVVPSVWSRREEPPRGLG
jgi:hypothetical protein